MNKKLMALVATGVIVFGGMGFLFMSVETVKAGYAGVVYNANGGIEQETLKQGWHFVAPWKAVTQYPVARETIMFSAENDEGKEGDTSISIGSKEGKYLKVNVNLVAKADPTRLPEIYTNFKGQSFEILTQGIIKQVVKAELSKISTNYPMFDIYSSKRGEVASEAEKTIAKELDKIGVIVESFEITGVVLDAETQKAVDALQQATMEQKQVEATAKAQQAKAEAEVKVAQAEALKAKAEAEIVVAKAKGQADAKIAIAEGDAKANQLLSASLTPQLVELKKLEINAETIKQSLSKWDGSVPTTIMSGNGNTQLPYLPIQLPSTK